MYFVTGLSYVLLLPSTARLALKKADIEKKALIPTRLIVSSSFMHPISIQYYFKRFDRINSPIFVAITRESQRQPTYNV